LSFGSPDAFGNPDGRWLRLRLVISLQFAGWMGSCDEICPYVVQNEYIRRVEKVNGELNNVEFATFEISVTWRDGFWVTGQSRPRTPCSSVSDGRLVHSPVLSCPQSV
jgi:hypothetical protein